MTKIREYRSCAEECRLLAQLPGNDSAQLLKIAAMWDELANGHDNPFHHGSALSWLQRAATRFFPVRAVRG